MEKNMKQIISEELEQFHCSILLEEVKEKIRKLKAYGVEDDRIVAVMNEGIVLKYLPDYRKELTALYLKLRPYGLTDRVKKSIIDVTNPTQNSINEKCARIRKLFSSLLPKNVAKYYAISGKRGEAKKIDLVRANVVWKCKMPNSQGL